MRKESVYNKRYRHAHRDRAAAHAIVNRAVRTGRLVRMPCEKCGNVKSEAHHEDYSKPLVVRWLCSTHHKEQHKPKADPSRRLQWQHRQNEKRKAARRLAAMSRPPKATKRFLLKEQAVAMRQSGMKYEEIGKALGMSKAHAYKTIKQTQYK